MSQLIYNVKKKEKYATSIFGIYVFCLSLSFIFLLICTKSSPLYPFNDWQDSNAYFTMGKGMMNGKVLYRDLFEQKGPYLYLIYAFAYLISNTTFLGVFLFEVISFSFFLFYSHKIVSLFLDVKYSIISLPILTTLILNLRNFTHGGSAEEFCLPLITISLYSLLNYFKNEYPHLVRNKYLFLNGIIAGCILWLKFSMLGFWFGWMASMFVCMIVSKNYLRAIKGCLIFLFGMVLTTLPWIYYFWINNSISTWLNTYIYINIFYYPVNASLISRMRYILIQIVGNTGASNPIVGIIFLYGIILFIIYGRFIKNALCRICLFSCILFLALGVYGGLRGYTYYFLIFSPFAILGLITYLDFLRIKFDNEISLKISIVTVIIFLAVALPLTLKFNHNVYLLKTNKENLVQYEFASVINHTKNAKLLNYGNLDFGFYTSANIIPNVRFFANLNIDYSKYPLIMDEQNRYIKDKLTDYIVIAVEPSVNSATLAIPYLYDNYNLIMEKNQIYENNDYKYLLFKVMR